MKLRTSTSSDILCVPKAKGKASVSDSGYGSIEYMESTDLSSMASSFYPSIDQEMDMSLGPTESAPGSRFRASISESEYSSLAYPASDYLGPASIGYGDSNDESIYQSTTSYCEKCYRDFDKKRYFNNNADRRYD